MSVGGARKYTSVWIDDTVTGSLFFCCALVGAGAAEVMRLLIVVAKLHAHSSRVDSPVTEDESDGEERLCAEIEHAIEDSLGVWEVSERVSRLGSCLTYLVR